MNRSISRREFMKLSAFAGMAAVGGQLTGCDRFGPAPFGNPNIVFIVADDLGYGDLSSLNKDAGIQTPHMDRIVAEGIHFTDFHSNSAVCTPSRYGVLTGRYAWRSRLKSGVLWGYDEPLIEEDRVTVGSFMQASGYHTACIGKWHLGLGWQKKDPSKPIAKYEWNMVFERGADSNVDFSKRVQGGPTELGFDYSYIIPASLDMTPYVYIENGRVVELPTAYTEGKDESMAGRGVFWRAGEVAPSFDFYDVFSTLTRRTVTYLESRKGQTKPFFLYFPLTAPHTPWLPSDAFHGKSQAGTYGDFVTMVDDTVGSVLETLDRLDMADNTLIIVTSDNGAHWTPEDKSRYAHRANYIYRGQKADIYEGGHRVAHIARWPGHIPAGSKSDQLMCTTDLLATLSGITNKALPTGAGEDSYNMLDAYLGRASEESIRDFVIHHSLNGHFSIRKGQWKLTPHLGSGGFSQPSDHDPREAGKAGSLYDLEKDPGEIHNVYNEYPEVVSQLAETLAKAKVQGRQGKR